MEVSQKYVYVGGQFQRIFCYPVTRVRVSDSSSVSATVSVSGGVSISTGLRLVLNVFVGDVWVPWRAVFSAFASDL
jgi:hypothetical protein